jgi:hypothetical protein
MQNLRQDTACGIERLERQVAYFSAAWAKAEVTKVVQLSCEQSSLDRGLCGRVRNKMLFDYSKDSEPVSMSRLFISAITRSRSLSSSCN